MKNLTSLFRNLLFLTLAMTSLTFMSCERDVEGCTDPLSDNYNDEANVDDGTCIPARDKFLGSFNNTAICEGDNYQYAMTITISPTAEDEVLISNLVDSGQLITAKILGDKITLVEAVYYGETLNGTGEINSDTITFSITINDGNSSATCVVTAVKQ